MTEPLHVVSVSSGVGSAYLWHLVAESHQNVTAVFADVNGEHKDNYRFLAEVEAIVPTPLVRLDNDGRRIWDVFRTHRFLGNTRVDICSRELKRTTILGWLEANCDHASTVMHIGIDWTEEHRLPAIRDGWNRLGWQVQFDLADADRDKQSALDWLEAVDILPPILTRRGYPHANCKGGCVRAGMGQFAALSVDDPEAFEEWASEEEGMRQFLGREDIAILRDRRGGVTKPMTLRQLKIRVDRGEVKPDRGDGSCRCMDFTVESV
jgi:Phosphoadenosine phosphosulfate reductase family